MLTWFYYYNAKNYLSPKFDKKETMKNVRFSVLGGPSIYILAGLLAWVSVYVTYIIFALTPLLYILPLDKEIKGEDGQSLNFPPKIAGSEKY